MYKIKSLQTERSAPRKRHASLTWTGSITSLLFPDKDFETQQMKKSKQTKTNNRETKRETNKVLRTGLPWLKIQHWHVIQFADNRW